MLDKLAAGIGYVILMLGGFYVLAILGAYILESIILNCEFGKEFLAYCKWKKHRRGEG